MIENPIKSHRDLVDVVIGENVSFRDGHVASVVHDVLIAAKGVLFSESRGAAGHEICRLVIAEARKDSILRREVVIHTNVE